MEEFSDCKNDVVLGAFHPNAVGIAKSTISMNKMVKGLVRKSLLVNHFKDSSGVDKIMEDHLQSREQSFSLADNQFEGLGDSENPDELPILKMMRKEASFRAVAANEISNSNSLGTGVHKLKKPGKALDFSHFNDSFTYDGDKSRGPSFSMENRSNSQNSQNSISSAIMELRREQSGQSDLQLMGNFEHQTEVPYPSSDYEQPDTEFSSSEVYRDWIKASKQQMQAENTRLTRAPTFKGTSPSKLERTQTNRVYDTLPYVSSQSLASNEAMGDLLSPSKRIKSRQSTNELNRQGGIPKTSQQVDINGYVVSRDILKDSMVNALRKNETDKRRLLQSQPARTASSLNELRKGKMRS
jgi:hypothetical protein